MEKYFKIIIVIVLLSGFSACGKFFKETSQNYSYVASVKDLQELLVGGAFEYSEGCDPTITFAENAWNISFLKNKSLIFIHLLDDDIAEYAIGLGGYPSPGANSWGRDYCANFHRWQRSPFIDHEGKVFTDENWKRLYKRIAVINSVLFQLDEMRNEEKNKDLCRSVEGEARYLRASHYFWLLNTYAEPYNKKIADKQLGVPLKISEAVEDRYFSRATLKEVYTQIVEDLTISEQSLKGLIPYNSNRVSHAAAATLLSRVYLYMEEYQKAIEYADIAIADENYSLLDLNSRKPENNFLFANSPETLFSQGENNLAVLLSDNRTGSEVKFAQANTYTSSPELLDLFEEKDMRRWAFFINPFHAQDGSKRCMKMRNLLDGSVSDHLLVRIAEAYLNKAEAEAALHKPSAKTTITELLRKRFAAGDVPNVTQTGDELLKFVRDERRRELCFEGHRWFDLRRYAVNNRLPFLKEIRHKALKYIGTDIDGSYVVDGEYVLKPYTEDKAAYMFPIPDYALNFNEGVLLPNPDRVAREMVTL